MNSTQTVIYTRKPPDMPNQLENPFLWGLLQKKQNFTQPFAKQNTPLYTAQPLQIPFGPIHSFSLSRQTISSQTRQQDSWQHRQPPTHIKGNTRVRPPRDIWRVTTHGTPMTKKQIRVIYICIYIHTVTMMHMHMHDVTQNVMLNVRRHMRTLMHVNVCPCSCSCMLACAHAHAHDPHVYTLQSQTQHLFISAEASRITCFKPAWATQASWV